MNTMNPDSFARAEPIDRSSEYTDADGRVDVTKLIAAYTHDEHVVRADAYFSGMDNPWIHVLRKPFSNLTETPAMLAGFATVLQIVEPRPEQVVVDFGCGTGWLSQALGMMGCRPIGLDISNAALEIARKAVAEHVYLRDRPIDFRLITPDGIPLEDQSIDRIICFDSFHHVADQAFYLSEFFRILKPGGIVGFNEPGPHHSQSVQSQYEMRQFAVIENDIVIEDIEAHATAIGFTDLKLALYLDTPVMVTRTEMTRAFDERPADVLQDLGRQLIERSIPRRVFSMKKPGEEVLDSRFKHAFDARIEPVRTDIEGGSRLVVTVTNTGLGTWLPSGGNTGSVNLGVKLFDANGLALTPEPHRFYISNDPVAPGETVVVDVSLAHPQGATMEIDMVSEMVAWLSFSRGLNIRI